MGSGNFLVGEGLTIKGFTHYVQPALQEIGLSVPDKLVVDHDDETKILTSIVGPGNLEEQLSKVLVEAGRKIEEVERGKSHEDSIVWKHHVSRTSHYEGEAPNKIPVDEGNFEMIGVYQEDQVATQQFSLLGQRYQLGGLQKLAEEVSDTLGNLGRALAKIDR